MNRAATLALVPLSMLYGAAIRTRIALYRNGVFQTYKVAAPVISVGNITTGGTGKTPLVEWIARKLAQRDRRVCILTRGYGRTNSHQRVIASDGNRILSDAEHSGDEALLLAEKLKGEAAVICDSNRVSAANWAVENFESDVLVLDDGFQNLRIARDLNIVTIDATNPWNNRWLLPAGLLREPIKGLARADCIVLTRVTETIASDLLKQVQAVSDAVVLMSRMVTSRIRSLNSTSPISAMGTFDAKAIAAFCGIGNPQDFFQHLRGEDFGLLHTAAFRDHHKYSQADIDQITREAIAHGAQALVTTAKDEVKLRSMHFDLPCYVMDIEVEISEEDKLLDLMERAILTNLSS
jgi:tetraacyldisaccharide 4'-kinase